MKVAVTATGSEMTSDVDMRFGRAKWFIIHDDQTRKTEAVSNVQNLDSPQGAGIQAARQIVDAGAEVLITGNIGPNAFRVLQAAAVTIYKVEKERTPTVTDAIEAWRKGDLEQVGGATKEGHWI
ncbi:MAG: NifB/NifX family molybdenum-iron cluster-binding protein [Deltaproteobacteria bacterium]|nr:NifB/NifX family molybdenum-iron cluster-binding protein [Deltaproteobacteria bacterium]